MESYTPDAIEESFRRILREFCDGHGAAVQPFDL